MPIKRKRSALVDLIAAGLVGSLLPGAVAWRSGTFAHSEATTRQADDQAYRTAQLELERDKLRQQECDTALEFLGDESVNPALTDAETRALTLSMQNRLRRCPASAGDQNPSPVGLLPAPAKKTADE
jgi:hypothetical protein